MLTTPEKLIKLLMARNLYANPTKKQRTAFATLKAFISEDMMEAYQERAKLSSQQALKSNKDTKKYNKLDRDLKKKIEYNPDPKKDDLSDIDITKYQVKVTSRQANPSFTKAECDAWQKDKTRNPKTGRKISATAKNGVYKQLEKACA